MKVLRKLREGLARTREGILRRMGMLRGAPDEEVLDALEEALLGADIGVDLAEELLERMRGRMGGEDIWDVLKQELMALAEVHAPPVRWDVRPHVVLVMGVNGTGKTTTIAKLAYRFREEGKRVLLAACDTFRAAAIEQLEVWAERVGADVVRHRPGADPAAVAYDALAAAQARGMDVVLVDTAGRMHTRANLMQELAKVVRVMGREVEGAPHERLLVLDATVGQNALSQARQFHDQIGLTGLVMTKLDGTAKGGSVLAVQGKLGVPVRWVGVGEGLEDLQPFDAREFVEALLGNGEELL